MKDIMTVRKIPITVLLDKNTIEKLNEISAKNRLSISATARALIEQGLTGVA